MRRKLAKNHIRIPRGIWRRNPAWTSSTWHPTYVREQQTQVGEEYQTYAYGPNNEILFAGVTRHNGMNRAIARQIACVWSRWRKEYVQHNPGTYPTTQTVAIPVSRLFVFPCDSDPRVTGNWYEV